jgi:hypothetical protein
VPWIAPSLAACALSLLDCLWSARSGSLVDYYVLWVVAAFMLIQRPLRVLAYVCGTHLGSRRLHMKIIGERTSNLCLNNGTNG